jgi:hypothetical protein
MTLAVIKCGDADCLKGRLKYRREDNAFDFEPSSVDELVKRTGSQGITSLALGTLQIELGVETGRLLYVWGYHPSSGWATQELVDVDSETGCLAVTSDAPLVSGVSLSLGQADAWTTMFDSRSGWVAVEPVKPGRVDQYIEIAENVLIGLADQQIVSLRLRPEYT